MFIHRSVYRTFALLIITSLLLSSAAPLAHGETLSATAASSSSDATTLFRTRVRIQTAAQWRDLERLNPLILEQGADWALVLVDETQLETLARWRFNPTETNAVETLAAADSVLAASIGSLLHAVSAQSADSTAATSAALQALSAEQRTALATAPSADSDNDGLSDDQEGFWCTDPERADSDSDGTNDYDEVTALQAWMGNDVAGPPSSGKPFQGWPSQIDNCFDDDQDAVPDRAENLELGLNAGRESTDRDKFDDGQELFGQTYCTGQGGFCSYGPLPRNEDWGVIFAEMPSWVQAPGNHPLVAAFPVPEIDVVGSSLKVETVTTVTTDHVISEGTEQSYSTAKTEGASTSVANTETWNEWMEISVTVPEQRYLLAAGGQVYASSGTWWKFGGEATTVVGGIAAGAVCAASLGIGCVALAGLAVAGVGAKMYGESLDEGDVSEITDSSQLQRRCVNMSCIPISGAHSGTEQQSIDAAKNMAESQNRTISSGTQYASNEQEHLTIQPVYNTYYPITRPTSTRTNNRGNSYGGSQTTTSTTYEEHTVTNGEAFSSSESWGTATAVDSAHAADLTFTYRVRNSGMEYAREIANLAFNLYIGDDPNPAITYFVADDLGGNGKFENFMPDEEHEYASRRIPLSLEQMRAIDLGAPIRMVVEDFTYGIDELFYQDAANASLLIALEDGTDDGDEAIDTYLIPTWGSETVLQVLARYFPHETDDNGTLIAIWTPEYRSDTPSWCQEPRRPTDFPNKALWCKHTLSTADWWNVYTDGLGDGSQGFQDTTAVPGGMALFRFNQDSDLDGFSDRSEARLGTDPDDAASHPKPELLAGLHSIRSGGNVQATLSLLNTGVYDAYGVEAVMIAPDDSVSITNNTVGGSGRVRALDQVIVGSRIVLESPLPSAWTQAGHAVPTPGGYYTGAADRTYTFTMVCGAPSGCRVGEGTWQIHWDDGNGNSGNLQMGSAYKSPTFLPVGDLGLTLALHSGDVSNGESFTVEGRTPRDTFQYTINREPYTEPLVVVSHNDPQGNHRFVLPPDAMELAAPTDNLQRFAGQMLPDVGVELVTQSAFAPGSNRIDLLVNNPSGVSLQDAHLFLEFIDPDGTVVRETSTQTTLASGPTYVTMNFDSGSFSPAYNDEQDYIVLAFLTDHEGNIIDTAGRPLSSFQADPLPQLVVNQSTLTWNFGSAPQGALLTQQVGLANTGYGALYTYIDAADGLSLSQAGSSTVGAADVADYALTLNTADLPVGAYNQTATLTTSDPDQPALTLRIQGTVTANNGDTGAGAIQRPLDVPVEVTGNHSQGEWFPFDYALGPDAGSLHPVRVYSDDYATLHGVGKVATSFGQGTASAEIFGDGSDGDLVVTSGETKYTDEVSAVLSNSAAAGEASICVASTNGLNVDDEILIIQNQGSDTGNYEFAQIRAIDTCWLTLKDPLQKTYITPNSKAQVLRVPQYRNVTIDNGATLTAHSWDGNTGGVIVFRVAEELNVNGHITASGRGFRGGSQVDGPQGHHAGHQGEGSPKDRDTHSSQSNGNGGGGGIEPSRNGGAGGGYGTEGSTGYGNSAHGGAIVGDSSLNSIFFGGGGGSAAAGDTGGENGSAGGNGGGIVIVIAKSITVNSLVSANGSTGSGSQEHFGGGGGAGGAILVRTTVANIGSVNMTAQGGQGGGPNRPGGNGGDGRIRIEYCESLVGTTNPPASTQKLDCYITEQTAAGSARLNLPEAVSGSRTYAVQFGRKLNFTAADAQSTTLRVPAALLSSATLDLLLSDAGTGDLTFTLDIGNDGEPDWTDTQTVNGSAQLSSPDLAAAFNRYWKTQGSPTGGTLDVPVTLALSRAAGALLTNLQVRQAGSRLRSIRVPAGAYEAFSLDVQVGSSGTGPLAVGLDVGDNGTIDWSYADDAQFPILLNTGDLAGAFNSYLNGKTGLVDVPLRFYLSPHTSLRLHDYAATTGVQTELAADALTIGGTQVQAAAGPREGDLLTVEAIVRNTGSAGSQNLTAAFFAHAEGWGDWYIGSAFVQNLPAGGSAPISVQWDTTGFGGDVPVKMVVNPYGRIGESDYGDNSVTQSIYIEPLEPDDPDNPDDPDDPDDPNDPDNPDNPDDPDNPDNPDNPDDPDDPDNPDNPDDPDAPDNPDEPTGKLHLPIIQR